MKTSIKVSWILWCIVFALILLMIAGLVVFTLIGPFNGIGVDNL